MQKKIRVIGLYGKYVNICVYNKFIITYIYIYTWNPSQHCFGWKCLVLRVYLQKIEVAWALGIYEGVRILKDNKSPMYNIHCICLNMFPPTEN